MKLIDVSRTKAATLKKSNENRINSSTFQLFFPNETKSFMVHSFFEQTVSLFILFFFNPTISLFLFFFVRESFTFHYFFGERTISLFTFFFWWNNRFTPLFSFEPMIPLSPGRPCRAGEGAGCSWRTLRRVSPTPPGRTTRSRQEGRKKAPRQTERRPCTPLPQNFLVRVKKQHQKTTENTKHVLCVKNRLEVLLVREKAE